MFKIGDWGLAKRHHEVTVLRDVNTTTSWGTRAYEPPEVTHSQGANIGVPGTSSTKRSRLYDVWAMGCITLEFLIWLAYGVEELKRFNQSLARANSDVIRFYQIKQLSGTNSVAEVHPVVNKWLDHMGQDPIFEPGTTALGNLHEIVKTCLLVVKLPKRLATVDVISHTESETAQGLPVSVVGTSASEDFAKKVIEPADCSPALDDSIGSAVESSTESGTAQKLPAVVVRTPEAEKLEEKIAEPVLHKPSKTGPERVTSKAFYDRMLEMAGEQTESYWFTDQPQSARGPDDDECIVLSQQSQEFQTYGSGRDAIRMSPERALSAQLSPASSLIIRPIKQTTFTESSDSTIKSNTPNKSDRFKQTVHDVYFGFKLFQDVSQFEQRGNISRLSQSLPKLLKVFARKLGSEDSKQINRDIMKHVYKHRVFITRSFQQNRAPDETQSGKDRDPFALDSDDDEEDFNPGLAEYQRVIEGSSAYSWLRSKLKHDLLHFIPGDPYMSIIGDAILSHDLFSRISRKSSPPTCDARYVVDWDPMDFIESQTYTGDVRDVVLNALTLTGSQTEAEALTCGDYVKRTWPESGCQFLALCQTLVISKRGVRVQVTIDDGTTICAFMDKTDCIFSVAGPPDTVVEIGEQIAWISCALRRSDVKGPVICIPILRDVSETGQTQTSISLSLIIGASISPVELTGSDRGFCWISLFRNPMLVQGYPIARRSAQSADLESTGLEMSLDIMMALTQSRRLAPFKQNLFVKGHSTMLMATKKIGGIVFWHVISNEDGRYIYYHDERVNQFTTASEDNILSLDFTERHVVGWWPHVQNMAGRSNAQFDVRGTGIQSHGVQLAFERINVGGGKYFVMSASIALGNRDKPLQCSKEGFYSDQIRQALTKYVVFFDVHEKRAWLVDGAAALLHIVRASLVADEENGFRLLNGHKDIQEKKQSEKEQSKSSAVGTLTKTENMNLKLYENPKDEESHTEITQYPAKTEVTVTNKATYYHFSDRVSIVYSVLDDIFNHQTDISSNGVGLKISKSPLNQLEGFDFYDIASGAKTLDPRALRLEHKAKGWVNMLRDLHAITLFGHGFGDILKAQVLENTQFTLCKDWIRVPTGLNYLAMSNVTLQRILKSQSEQDQSQRLVARKLYWHCPDKYCEGCTDSHTNPNTSAQAQSCHCDRVQVILRRTIFDTLFDTLFKIRRFQSPTQIPIDGGTIFG